MTYNERIMAIAEEMAEHEFPKQKTRYNANRPDIWMDYVQKKAPDARIAVKHIADIYTHMLSAYLIGKIPDERIENEVRRRAVEDGYVPQEQGSIPGYGREADKS